MKKLMIVCVIVVLLLCGCQTGGPASNGTEATAPEIADANSNLEKLPFYAGTGIHTVGGSANSKGSYFMWLRDSEWQQAYITDFELAEQRPLCYQEGCDHTDHENCDSYYKVFQFYSIIAAEDRVFWVMDQPSEFIFRPDDPPRFFSISVSEVDGSNRHELLTLDSWQIYPAGEWFYDGSFIYVPLADSQTQTPMLYKIDAETGEIVAKMLFSGQNQYLTTLGVVNGEMLFVLQGEPKTEDYGWKDGLMMLLNQPDCELISVSSADLSQTTIRTFDPDDEMFVQELQVPGSSIVYCSRQEDRAIIAYDVLTGETKKVMDKPAELADLPIPAIYYSVIDGKLFFETEVYTYFDDGGYEIESFGYYIDLTTLEINSIQLEITGGLTPGFVNAPIFPYEIDAEHFFVNVEVREVSITAYGPDGLPAPLPITQPRVYSAIISKTDYYAGTPNYQMIEPVY